jgi:excinuclease ABC subunit A
VPRFQNAIMTPGGSDAQPTVSLATERASPLSLPLPHESRLVERVEMDDPGSRDEVETIRVRGARVHNLRDITIGLPRNQLVVLTGVSGSGKSSLAFDTIFAEGQRRYLEGLSTYARQFLDQLERPDVDAIDGLPPTVAIDQKSGAANPRSTVATVTEINDYLRLLYARTGTPHCPACGESIERRTPEQIVDGVLALGEGRKVIVMAPLVRGRKGLHREAFEAIQRAGLLRARVDGEIIEVREEPKLARSKPHDIEAVVDRLVVREGVRARLAESVALALKLGDGSVLLSIQKGDVWDDRLLSVKYACPSCGTGFAPLEPRSFSFNSPYGACPACDGLGYRREFDPELVIPDRGKSLREGAVAAWASARPDRRSTVDEDQLDAFLASQRLTRDSALKSWSARSFEEFLRGDAKSGFLGVIPTLTSLMERAKTEAQKAALDAFRSEETCPSCQGARLKPEARAVTLGGLGIHDLSRRTIDAIRDALLSLEFAPPHDLVGPSLIKEIDARLGFLDRVGLSYLSLDRNADSLSGGELQRVRLAAQIGSGLVGVAYILDEPTAGLHPSDTTRLLKSLLELRDLGNSLIVVEHDEETIRAADWLVDLGPGAGPDGGRIVATGPPDALIATGESSTSRYLRGEIARVASRPERLRGSAGRIEIKGAAERNLKCLDASIPLGTLTCVTGVSGSGKSTLVNEILARAVRRHLGLLGPKPGKHTAVLGLGAIDKLIEIDQTPIGRGPRSTPATFTGVFDEIRRVYAQTREAKIRGYAPSRFSFNVKGGRCETCQGQGARKIEMSFLPDLYVKCEACEGKRFNPATLEVRFKERSVGDVLEMRVDDAIRLFENQPRVRRGLESLHEAGLGYLTLGQSSTTLSGGEAQRVKLASELGRSATGKTLYILDEPTTGLHFADVARLLNLLNRLVDLGNTIVVIEHNLDVIRASDWIIDLGPGAGDLGGTIVAMGTPASVASVTESLTGRWITSEYS